MFSLGTEDPHKIDYNCKGLGDCGRTSHCDFGSKLFLENILRNVVRDNFCIHRIMALAFSTKPKLCLCVSVSLTVSYLLVS